MFGWFTAIRLLWGGLPGPLRKGVVYAGIALALLYGFRMYSNRLYAKAKAEVRQEITKELVKKHEAELLEIRKSIESEKQANVVAQTQMRNEYLVKLADQEKRFKIITSTLQSTIKTIELKRIEANEILSRISDDDLDNYLRDLSRKLSTNSAGETEDRGTVK